MSPRINSSPESASVLTLASEPRFDTLPPSFLASLLDEAERSVRQGEPKMAVPFQLPDRQPRPTRQVRLYSYD